MYTRKMFIIVYIMNIRKRETEPFGSVPCGLCSAEFDAEPSAADQPFVFDAGVLEEGFLGFLDKAVELFFAKELCGCLLCDALSVEIKCCFHGGDLLLFR